MKEVDYVLVVRDVADMIRIITRLKELSFHFKDKDENMANLLADSYGKIDQELHGLLSHGRGKFSDIQYDN